MSMTSNNDTFTDTDANNGETCHVRSALKRSLNHHVASASLTEIERTFLSKLLIDRPRTAEDEEAHKKKIQEATKVLNDDILFSVPTIKENHNGEEETSASGAAASASEDDHDNKIDIDISNHKHKPLAIEEKESHHPVPPRPTRSNEAQLDLWKAHNDGVKPKLLKSVNKKALVQSKRGSSQESVLQLKAPLSDSQIDGSNGNNNVQQSTATSRGRRGSKSPKKQSRDNNCAEVKDGENRSQEENDHEEDNEVKSLDVQSDQKVGSINDESTASSWNSSQGGFDHYDTWEVLRDEYAEDFGFKVAVDDEDKLLPYNNDDEDNDQRGIFKILGTSTEDTRAHPHALSPPLMDSLLNFVPDHLANDNFWLKFSLIRDGASLDILKRYCRAATHTVLAIETTNGEVFGSFTSTPWRTSRQYFGTGESFLWRMRHGRNTPVHSLFEQAQLESEIDIFPYNGSNDYVQLCTHDKLALGGGDTLKRESSIQENEGLDIPPVLLENELYGFGLALDKNLLHGTTSPSATFGNSNLINGSGSGETFDVMNLEVWGFTSAQTEKGAEKSEMSMFFVRESISSILTSSANNSSSSLFSAEDLSQERFYRRVGQSDENESDRDAWQYANMMNPVVGSPYGKMGSPYGR